MKVAVAASGNDLNAPADPRFGRCQSFVVVDTDTMQFEAVPNTAATQGSGAGIAAAQLITNAGAEAVIAGNLGPNASQALFAGGLRVFQFTGGTVLQAVEALKAGQLQELTAPNVAAHTGVGGMGAGGGMGMGMGRGMGGGGGRGMGTGRGMGMGAGRGAGVPGLGAQPGPGSAEQLKQQADALEAQLEDLRRQIRELEER